MTTRLSTGLQNILAGRELELVANGTFDTDAASWAAIGAGCVITGGVDAIGSRDNVLRVTTAAGYASQAVATKIGHVYRLSFKHFDPTAGNGYVYAGSTQGGTENYSSGALNDATWAAGTYEVYFKATALITYISLGTAGADPQYYDDVSLVCMTGSMKQAFHLGEIRIYSGAQPTDPETAPTGVLLVTIKNGGTGITFGDAATVDGQDGALSKTVGETWSGVGVANGTAGWFRLQAQGDLGTTNSVDARIDGTIATSGGDMDIESLAFTTGATQTVSDYHPFVEM